MLNREIFLLFTVLFILAGCDSKPYKKKVIGKIGDVNIVKYYMPLGMTDTIHICLDNKNEKTNYRDPIIAYSLRGTLMDTIRIKLEKDTINFIYFDKEGLSIAQYKDRINNYKVKLVYLKSVRDTL